MLFYFSFVNLFVFTNGLYFSFHLLRFLLLLIISSSLLVVVLWPFTFNYFSLVLGKFTHPLIIYLSSGLPFASLLIIVNNFAFLSLRFSLVLLANRVIFDFPYSSSGFF